MRIVIERTPSGYSAYVPDLPGCVAAADSYQTAEQLIREAVAFHLEALRGDGDPIPEPQDVRRVGGGSGSVVGPLAGPSDGGHRVRGRTGQRRTVCCERTG